MCSTGVEGSSDPTTSSSCCKSQARSTIGGLYASGRRSNTSPWAARRCNRAARVMLARRTDQLRGTQGCWWIWVGGVVCRQGRVQIPRDRWKSRGHHGGNHLMNGDEVEEVSRIRNQRGVVQVNKRLQPSSEACQRKTGTASQERALQWWHQCTRHAIVSKNL